MGPLGIPPSRRAFYCLMLMLPALAAMLMGSASDLCVAAHSRTSASPHDCAGECCKTPPRDTLAFVTPRPTEHKILPRIALNNFGVSLQSSASGVLFSFDCIQLKREHQHIGMIIKICAQLIHHDPCKLRHKAH